MRRLTNSFLTVVRLYMFIMNSSIIEKITQMESIKSIHTQNLFLSRSIRECLNLLDLKSSWLSQKKDTLVLDFSRGSSNSLSLNSIKIRLTVKYLIALVASCSRLKEVVSIIFAQFIASQTSLVMSEVYFQYFYPLGD